jgi:hypothetical protein
LIRAENLATFMCCLDILGAPTFWGPEGLSRPVQIADDGDDKNNNNYYYTKWKRLGIFALVYIQVI